MTTTGESTHALEKKLTLMGWFGRLEAAAMNYVRTGETAEGWEKLQEVERQALDWCARQAREIIGG